MSKDDISLKLDGIDSGCPYKDLYVYYLQGRVKAANEVFKKGLIGNWEEEDFSFLFFSKPSHVEVNTLLRRQPQLSLLDHYQMTYDQWQGETLKPLKCGKFLIIPPWYSLSGKKDADEEQLRILLDPGVVFGAGTHTTTLDCLDALESACGVKGVQTVLDLGTGTGLLALAAARLGCRRVLAVDLNFLAVQTATRNIRLNRLEDDVLAVQGRAEDLICCSADLVIANIQYDVLKPLINSSHFRRKKWFVLSGLLRSQAKDVAYQLSQYPFKILNKWGREGIWHTFLGEIIV